MDQVPPQALIEAIAREYGFHVRESSPVAPSDEARAWRAEAERPLFIHQSPQWRTRAELTWVHQLLQQATSKIPEVVAPFVTKAGATFLEYGGALVTLYPFVVGAHLDRDDAAHLAAAAAELAHVHSSLGSCEMPPRPAPGPLSPWAVTSPRRRPAELTDPALDAWHAAFTARAGLARGLVHGDYYRRNLLWADARIVGVVDWHEARHDVLLAEVAGATWEFSKHLGSRDFSVERAHAFLDAYAAAGGPADVRDRGPILPLVRWRLREEALRSFALEERGMRSDAAYREAVTSSFNAFRTRSL